MARRTRKFHPESPLPPVEDTLAMLEELAVRRYETKARTRRALEMPHRTLRDLLQMLESYARYPNLVSRGVADDMHRLIRRGLRLDDPKRFPPLSAQPSVSSPTPPEVLAAATTPPTAMAEDRAVELFSDEGLEFVEIDRGGGR